MVTQSIPLLAYSAMIEKSLVPKDLDMPVARWLIAEGLAELALRPEKDAATQQQICPQPSILTFTKSTYIDRNSEELVFSPQGGAPCF